MKHDEKAAARRLIAAMKSGPGQSCGVKAGERLAARLNRLIDEQETDDRTREDIIGEMASAAGIDRGTVLQILNAEINCPPKRRLEGFAEVLKVSAQSLIRSAEQDGCDYNEDED